VEFELERGSNAYYVQYLYQINYVHEQLYFISN